MKTLLLTIGLMLPMITTELPPHYIVKAYTEIILYKAPWSPDGETRFIYLEEAQAIDAWEEYILIKVSTVEGLSYWYVHYSDIQLYKRKEIQTSPVLYFHIELDPLPPNVVQDSLINIKEK